MMKWFANLKKKRNGSQGASKPGSKSSALSLDIEPGKTARTPVELFEEILHRLGCTYDLEQDEDEVHLYRFMYQGGAFRVRVPKKGMGLLKMEFPSFVESTVEQLSALRTCCNQFNIVCKLSKFVYSFDASENKYQAHIISPFMLYEGMTTQHTFSKPCWRVISIFAVISFRHLRKRNAN